jgi:hypothetical protein
MTNAKQWKTLAPIRAAIKGWAFGPEEWIPGKIAQAEAIRKTLPKEVQDLADALIQPLREYKKGTTHA